MCSVIFNTLYMNKKQKNKLIWVGIIAVIIIFLGYSTYQKNQPGELDTFASCLEESGTTFYGAFWCPHCQDQKAMFGNSERLLPYVECSTADRQSVTIACQKAGIQSYPTWEFPDNTRETGALSLARLAEKSGCELPTGN